MPIVSFLYASHGGHTRSIALHAARAIEDDDVVVISHDLSAVSSPKVDFSDADVVVVLSSIRYGRPLKPVEQFLSAHRDALLDKKLALLLVSLTARKPEKRHLEKSVYLQKWVKRHQLAPQIVEGIAGKLDYPSYGWFDRLMIRFIMKLTGGPTNKDACIEFTDWEQVGDLAKRVVTLSKDF